MESSPMPRKSTWPPQVRTVGGSEYARWTDAAGRHHERLGPAGSSEAKEAYARLIATLTAPKAEAPAVRGATYTIATIAGRYYAAAQKTVCAGEADCIAAALKPLVRLFGSLIASEFTPATLKQYREAITSGSWMTPQERQKRIKHGQPIGWCVSTANRAVGRVKTCLKWGTEDGCVPPGVYYACAAVRVLGPTAQGVRHSEPPKAAFWTDVEAVIPHCPPPVATMLAIQWLTASRSQDVRRMRPMDIDRTDPKCWLYRPGSDAGPFGSHKNAWRGQTRVIPLGPTCIEILQPWLEGREPGEYLFNPKRWSREQHALRSSRRRSKPTPKQRAARDRTVARPIPNVCYTAGSYPQAVQRACQAAGVDFHPYALRHGRKRDIERQFGSDAARQLLGQRSLRSTERYGAEIDLGTAADVMRRLG
jgi:integrase